MDETSIRLTGTFDGPLGGPLQVALRRALALDSTLPAWVLELEGMSGRLYRRLINTLIGSIDDARYLEVGSWAGSTSCSAMHGNRARIMCIDNWSEFGGPRDTFFETTNAARTDQIDFTFLESDFRKVDYGAIGKFNVYLFDGPHTYQDQYDGVAVAQPALDDSYIQIVDDWNWPDVRNATLKSLADRGLTIRCAIKVRTTQDDTHPTFAQRQNSAWHNGYFIGVIDRA